MTPQHTVERRASSDYYWVKRFPAKELCGPLRALKPEARDLVNCLRDWASENDGLPTDEPQLLAIAETFRFSKYRFRKYWNGEEGISNGVKIFFTETDGRYYYTRDAQQAARLSVISSNNRENGKRGAEARWNSTGEQTEQPNDGEAILSPCPSPDRVRDRVRTNQKRDLYKQQTTTTTDQCAREEAKAGGGGGDVVDKSPQNTERTPTPDGYEQFTAHCSKLGMSIGSRVLWNRIRGKFSNLPLEIILDNLPRFDGQESPGAWDHHSAAVLQHEAAAQKQPRKPPARRNGKETLEERMMKL
jgi:hypothetical protein